MVTWAKEQITSGRPKSMPLDYVREATAQTHIVGSPLVLAAGLYSQAASDPATVNAFARKAGRSLATADAAGDPKLPVWVVQVGERFKGSLKEALSTVSVGTTVGLLKEGTDWVFSTTAVNKKFTIRFQDPLAAQADTYARIEVEYTG